MKKRWISHVRSVVVLAIAVGAVGALIAFVDAFLVVGDCQVRLDSGDTRYKGLLFSFPRSSFRGREQFIAASKELGIPSEWHDVHGAPSCPCCGPAYLYPGLEFWLEKEPELGKLMLVDIADYFEHPERHDGMPPAASLCRMVKWVEETGSYKIDRSNFSGPEFEFALSEMGYSPAPGGYVSKLCEDSPSERRKPDGND
ncbi:MAG: hypothetical protein KF805_12080 [Phycisphaeraceae bacterium]|nr:hypothetical protein [Phycisphaeraceae bacterium]